jgi:hypothetical protein
MLAIWWTDRGMDSRIGKIKMNVMQKKGKGQIRGHDRRRWAGNDKKDKQESDVGGRKEGGNR